MFANYEYFVNLNLILNPEDMTDTDQLAKALQRMGQNARARELFAKVSRAEREVAAQFELRSPMRLLKAKAAYEQNARMDKVESQ